MKRLAVLISGRGSNLDALFSAIQRYGWPLAVVGVISNRPNAPGLEIARAKGIATEVLDGQSAPIAAPVAKDRQSDAGRPG